MSVRPVVLAVAGYDPSSGAGVTADIKTIAAHGCYGITCITALTVQTTQGVSGVETVRAEVVRRTLQALAGDFEIAAVKVGMLGNSEVAREVAAFLERVQVRNVVVDPIVKSSSGANLIDDEGQRLLRKRIVPSASVVTPNDAEALALTGERDRRRAAEKLRAMGARNVVITGGDQNDAVDLLFDGEQIEELREKKIESSSTHGTGCAFSTAIACELAKGASVREAVIAAKRYVTEAIRAAEKLGKGRGPVEHFHRGI